MVLLSSLSTTELADGICLRAGRIAAAQAELMMWIAEFDRREGWAGTGLLSCAHWLSWRVGLSPGAAREQVRVARRLEDLPAVAQAFGDGRISYSKVRALTRVAEPGDGVDWVELCRHSSAGQLEDIVRGMRRAQFNAAAEADPQAAAWTLRTRTRYDEHGNFTLTISGPAEFLPVVQAGIEAKKAELQRQHLATAAETAPQPKAGDVPAGTQKPGAGAGPAETPEPGAGDGPAETPEREPGLYEQAPGWPAGTTVPDVRAAMAGFFLLQDGLNDQGDEPFEPVHDPASPASAPAPAPAPARDLPGGVPARTPTTGKVTDAQALLALAQDALATEHAAHPSIARRRRPQLTARIDPISGWGRLGDGELLPPSSLRAVMNTLPGRGGVLRLRPLTAADLRRYDLGRTSREANAGLRDLVGTLDGERCRFPGCTRHRKLHAHHVRYWSEGGMTDLDNLVLVCSRHHTLIHSHGFALVLHPDRRLEVHTAYGVPVLHHPAQPWGDPAALARGGGQPVCAETLPPDHCDARIGIGYIVNVLMAQAS